MFQPPLRYRHNPVFVLTTQKHVADVAVPSFKMYTHGLIPSARDAAGLIEAREHRSPPSAGEDARAVRRTKPLVFTPMLDSLGGAIFYGGRMDGDTWARAYISCD